MRIIMIHLRNIGGVSGGLEKVLCDFSRAMILRGHEVTVVVYDNTGKNRIILSILPLTILICGI